MGDRAARTGAGTARNGRPRPGRGGARSVLRASARRGWHARRLSGSASQFDRVDWVTATTPAVPFSAFSHLIEVPDTGKTAAVLRDCAGVAGRRQAADRRRRASAGQAVRGAGLPVGGQRRGEADRHGRAERVSSPMRFRRCGGTTCWRGSSVEPPGHDDNRLATLVEEFVAALPGPAHRVLEYPGGRGPAVARPILSALAGRDAVTDAEAAGAIVDRRGSRPSGAPAVRRRGPRRARRTRAAPAAHRAGGSAGRLGAPRRGGPVAARGALAGQRQPAAGGRRLAAAAEVAAAGRSRTQRTLGPGRRRAIDRELADRD